MIKEQFGIFIKLKQIKAENSKILIKLKNFQIDLLIEEKKGGRGGGGGGEGRRER